MPLEPDVKELLERPNFAAFTTYLPDGMPSTHVMWVGADDGHLVINTETGRQKYRNVQRDPRVCVTIVDRENPYHYAEVRGRVVETVAGDDARENIDELSRKYKGSDYPDAAITTERVILRIEPDRQRVWGR
jgi:PPOX class probable F420-dependent enzyme